MGPSLDAATTRLLPREGEWLGEEDSNPRYVVQSHASYR
jgi:hypothetical protein